MKLRIRIATIEHTVRPPAARVCQRGGYLHRLRVRRSLLADGALVPRERVHRQRTLLSAPMGFSALSVLSRVFCVIGMASGVFGA